MLNMELSDKRNIKEKIMLKVRFFLNEPNGRP
jgi:hypothetical protein